MCSMFLTNNVLVLLVMKELANTVEDGVSPSVNGKECEAT